jgi:hypothetical protein
MVTTYQLYEATTKTKLADFEETVFIKAIQNGKVIKRIEFYSFMKTYEGQEVCAANITLPITSKDAFRELHDGEEVFLSKDEVSKIVAQVDNKIIFSQTYTN